MKHILEYVEGFRRALKTTQNWQEVMLFMLLNRLRVKWKNRLKVRFKDGNTLEVEDLYEYWKTRNLKYLIALGFLYPSVKIDLFFDIGVWKEMCRELCWMKRCHF